MLILTIHVLQKIGYCHRDIKPDNIFVKNVSDSGPPLVLLGDWGCATDKLKFMNEEPTGRYDLRKGNGAYCPPEIVNADRGKELDYSRADCWSISLVALGNNMNVLLILKLSSDILHGGRSRGNPFYPVRNRQLLKNGSYDDSDLDFYLNKPSDVPTSIFSKIKKMLWREPSTRLSTQKVPEEIFCHVFDRPQLSPTDPVASLDRLDNWLIDLYQSILHKSQNVSETINCIKLCFLRNMTTSTFQPFFDIGILRK